MSIMSFEGLLVILLLVLFSFGSTAWAQASKVLLNDPAFLAARTCADILVEHGRDAYGLKQGGLFAAQLNAETHTIPTGTADDPGIWNGHREVAGYQPYCQNLLSDCALLDLLQALTRVTGDAKYDAARREYLASVLNQTRDPRSGYIPWGEHVGYNMVRDEVHVGDFKYWHEVKSFDIPWDQLWDVNPDATRHEIEVAFHNHLCNLDTFAFNRHASMDGKPNTGGDPCSLSSSAGAYIDAWCWLYKKTGEIKFLDWARKMNDHFWSRRSETTGLMPTDEVTRKDLMVYGEAVGYAPYLFIAAHRLGDEGGEFLKQASAYMLAYDRYAYTPARSDGKGPGFYDAVNIRTGEPVAVDGKQYLEPWQWIDNHIHVGAVLSAEAIAYGLTGDARFQAVFDHALAAMRISEAITQERRMLSCDAAGVIMSLVTVAKRSGDAKYLEAAKPLVTYVLDKNRLNGLFTSGLEGGERYYCSRTGSGTLATAVLAYALAVHGDWESVPPIRDMEGGLRF